MIAVAAACLIAALVAWSAVLATRGFARGGARVLREAVLSADSIGEWAVPYKLESTVPHATRPPLRPVSPRMAAVRGLCLAAYLERAQAENFVIGCVSAGPEPVAPAALNAWLRAEGLWAMLGEIERRGLEASPGQWDDSLRLYAEGAREALAMLAWAGHFEEELPAFDMPADAAALCATIGLLRPTAALLPDLALRADCELAAARELCQAWVWRARTALDQLDAQGGLAPLDVIRSAARYWSAAGAFTMIENDFPVAGRPFAALDAAACRRVHRTAQLRLQGLNWVCGLTHTWDHVSSRRLSM